MCKFCNQITMASKFKFPGGSQSLSQISRLGNLLCPPGTRRKEEKPCKRLTQTCLWVSMSLQWRCRLMVACCRVRVIEYGSACMGPFEGDNHYLHYLHHNLVSGQTTGRKQSPTHHQKIGLKIYWAWPHSSKQDPVFLSVSLSHQEASISLLSFSI